MKAIEIVDEIGLQSLKGELTRAFKGSGYLRVQWSYEPGRTGKANALTHVWYGQIARELGEGSPADVHAECKLDFGVPILRAEDDFFRDAYDRALAGLPRELQLRVVSYLPVTSLMSARQLSQYCDDMVRHYAQRGVILSGGDHGPA